MLFALLSWMSDGVLEGNAGPPLTGWKETPDCSRAFCCERPFLRSSFSLSQQMLAAGGSHSLDSAEPGSLRERQGWKQDLRRRQAWSGTHAAGPSHTVKLGFHGTLTLQKSETVWGDSHLQGPERRGDHSSPQDALRGCPLEEEPWNGHTVV